MGMSAEALNEILLYLTFVLVGWLLGLITSILWKCGRDK